ncbi:sensor histidine kinase [Streptomyces sp. SPB074]|uniref:sensor histidine kinase n=1 Tax=Streptomyces sp. (strain SPB074) TaxID=465543 RepID=UPI000682A311|nr:ATP-binding protein [Streptomyces sp. SPB074]
MTHLRASAGRADRRDGGARHGRPGALLPESHIRTLLLRTAVLPALAVALSGLAAVLLLLGAEDDPGGAVKLGVALSAAVALAALCGAVLAARRASRTVLDRVGALRTTSARRQTELRGLVDRLRRGELPPVREAQSRPDRGGDGLDLLADELHRFHDVAMASVVRASQLSTHAGHEQKVEVFVNLSRRLQSLVHRQIQVLDELESGTEDPALLKGLFHIDHLATRTRRHAENLAVLGGSVSRRQWSTPIPLQQVLRSAVAEVEQYPRVRLVPPVDGAVHGQNVADIVHLIAELVENATLFSAPHTPVLLRAGRVAAGLAVEIEDRGLGLDPAERHRMNTVLADPDQVNLAGLLQDGRIGLYVVATLARRHGIAVRLQSNIYGGVQAVVVLPTALLGEPPANPAEAVAGGAAAEAVESGAGRTAGSEAAEDDPAGTATAEPSGTVETETDEAEPVEAEPVEAEVVEEADAEDDARREADAVAGRAAEAEPVPVAAEEDVATAAGESHRTGGTPPRDGEPRTPDDETAGATPAAGHPPLPVRGALDSLPSRRTPHPRVPGNHRTAPSAVAGEPSPPGTSPSEEAAPAPRPGTPLPVRGANGGPRATPADARPGTQPGAPRVSFADAGAILALTRRDGSPVSDPEGPAPGLPKREAQTHMVPQLRRENETLPQARAETPENEDALHTPDLMAAFRQGYDRAFSLHETVPQQGEPTTRVPAGQAVAEPEPVRADGAGSTRGEGTPADRDPAGHAPVEPPARAD